MISPDEIRYQILINLDDKDANSLYTADIKYLAIYENELFFMNKFFFDNPNFKYSRYTSVDVDWCIYILLQDSIKINKEYLKLLINYIELSKPSIYRREIQTLLESKLLK